MTEKYFQLNDEIFIFHPDSYEVLRVAPQCCERLERADVMRALRLQAQEITRQQAERAVPALEKMCRRSYSAVMGGLSGATAMTPTDLIAQFGWVAVFIGALLEGETVVLIAAVMVQQGLLDFKCVLPAAVLGAFAGDQFFFHLGRHHGSRLFSRDPVWQRSVKLAIALAGATAPMGDPVLSVPLRDAGCHPLPAWFRQLRGGVVYRPQCPQCRGMGGGPGGWRLLVRSPLPALAQPGAAHPAGSAGRCHPIDNRYRGIALVEAETAVGPGPLKATALTGRG